MQRRDSAGRGLELAPCGCDMAPSRREVGEGAAGDSAEDGGAEQHRLFRRVATTGLPVASARSWRTRSSWPAPPLIMMRRIGAPLAACASMIWRSAVADAAEAGDVERDEAVEVASPCRGRRSPPGRADRRRARGCRGIRARHAGPPASRTTSERSPAPAAAAFASQPGSGCASVSAARRGFCGRRMEREQVVDGGAGGGLAALVQPGAGHHGREIRAPRRRARRPARAVVVIVQDEVPKT